MTWVMKPPPVITVELTEGRYSNESYTHIIRLYTRSGRCFLAAFIDRPSTMLKQVYLYDNSGATFDVICSGITWLEKVVESPDPLAYLEAALQ